MTVDLNMDAEEIGLEKSFRTVQNMESVAVISENKVTH